MNITNQQRPIITSMLVVLMCLFLQGKAAAQEAAEACKVSGIVVDSLTKEGEMYATVKITTKENTEKAVKMAATDKSGAFAERLTKAGDYTLFVNAMGRKQIVRQFTVKPGEKTVSLDTLYISDASKELSGVEVVAQKPLVKADIDKIEYNMEDDPDSKTNNILEMLRKVPMVTVDGDENIKVNGSSNFKVYVNGRPNNMMSNNPKDVLKSMPASSIKKIEVITNPGPKYDAEGVGGILNIITVGKGIEGYTANFSINASNRGVGSSVYSTIKKGKFTMSARYSYNHNNSPKSTSESNMQFTGDPETPSANNTTSKTITKNLSNSHSGDFEASYDIDTLRLVTASFGFWKSYNNGHGNSSFESTSPLDGSPLYSYYAPNKWKNHSTYLNGSIDYQRLFKLKERMLTFSYRVSSSPSSSLSHMNYEQVQAADDWTDFTSRFLNQNYDNDGRSTEHTFQIDYTTPIGKMHTIETGAKYILRDNRANTDRYIQKPGAEEFTFDDDYSTHYRHQNDILAVYAGYGLKWNKLSGRLGMRYEHTFQDVKYLLGSGDNFKKRFNDFVPSASLGYKIDDEQNLRFAYNMRIWRPNIWCLNPFLNQSSPSYLSQGNPNLVSEKNHSFAFTYNYFAAKFSTSWTIRHSFTNNSIETVLSYLNDTEIEGVKDPTDKMVSYSTFKNIGKNQTTSLSGYLNWTIFKNTRLYANVWVDYSDYNDRQSLHNYGWYASGYVGLQQTLPKNWKINAGFSGWTSNPSLQSKSDGSHHYNLNVQKSMLKDRLTFSLSANNFLETTRHYKSTDKSSNFLNTSDYAYKCAYFSLNVSLRLGELSSGVKKAQKTIENDDVKSGGGK